VHPELGKANWLFFKEDSDFDVAFQSLVAALDTDLAHVKEHTRLLVKALEWEKKHRRDDLLLRGQDLIEAEQWLTKAFQAAQEPQPTEQQKTYIHKSRDVQAANQRLAIAGEQAKRLVRVGTGVLAGTIAIATVIGILTVRAFRQLHVAQTATRLEREGNLALQQMEDAPLEALLTAVRSSKALQELVRPDLPIEQYPTTTPLVALRTILDNIREKNKIQAHQGSVADVSFSPDGARIATAGSPDTIVRLWDLAGAPLAELEGHQASVRRVEFSPDGSVVGAVGRDGTVRLWSAEGDAIATLTGHEGHVLDISFDPEGEQVATSGEDGTVHLWTLEGQSLAQFTATAITTRETSGIGVNGYWDTTTQAIVVLSVLPNSPEEAVGLRIGDRIIEIDGQALESLEDTSLLRPETGESITLTIAREGKPTFAKVIERQPFTTSTAAHLTSLMFSTDGEHIVTGDEAGMIRRWSLAGEQLSEFQAHDTSVSQVLFSPDGTRIVSIARGEPAKLWTLEGNLLSELPLENQIFFTRAAFSPDGQTIVTVGEEGVTQLWTLNGEELQAFKGHNSVTFGVDFSPDGQTLVTYQMSITLAGRVN